MNQDLDELVRMREFLPHGPTKLYIDEIIYNGEMGLASLYRVQEKDTLDHFGYFRGVDQVETCGQASLAWHMNRVYLKRLKKNKKVISFDCLANSINEAVFLSPVSTGDLYLTVCSCKHLRSFVEADSVGYVIPSEKEESVRDYFSNLKKDSLLDADLKDLFGLVETAKMSKMTCLSKPSKVETLEDVP